MRNRSIAGAHRQAGYTIIELVVVFTVIIVFVGGVVVAVTRFSGNQNYTEAQLFLTKQFTEAAFTVFGRRGTINGADKTAIVDAGASAGTAWGDAWTMSTCAANQCTITYPLASTDDPDTVGADMVAYLNRTENGQRIFRHITSATYNSGTSNLVVVMRIR